MGILEMRGTDELIRQGAYLVSLAKGDFIPTDAIKLQLVAKVLCFRGNQV